MQTVEISGPAGSALYRMPSDEEIRPEIRPHGESRRAVWTCGPGTYRLTRRVGTVRRSKYFRVNSAGKLQRLDEQQAMRYAAACDASDRLTA